MRQGIVWVTLGSIAAMVAFVAVDRVRAAGIPPSGALAYSGVLFTESGEPYSGSVALQVKLWADREGGDRPLCESDSSESVQLTGGRFELSLPDACVGEVHADPEIWIELVVNGTAFDRVLAGAVPYSVEAESAANASGPLDERIRAVEEQLPNIDEQIVVLEELQSTLQEQLVSAEAQIDANIDAQVENVGAQIAAVAARSVPSGAVMFFDLDACPSGWSPFEPARGRYVTGVPVAGTRGAEVGTALTDQENRPVGQHEHGLDDPGHTHPLVRGSGTNDSFPGGQGEAPGNFSFRTESAVTNISVSAEGEVPGTNAPYVQLLACRKL
jgi:hypothetical protein